MIRIVIPGPPADRAQFRALLLKLLQAKNPRCTFPRTVGVDRSEWHGGGRHVTVTVTEHTAETEDGIEIAAIDETLIEAELGPGPPQAKALTGAERGLLTALWATRQAIELPDVVPDAAVDRIPDR